MVQSITVFEYLQRLEKKYRGYMENLQWHIDTNKPTGMELEKIQQRINDYKEIVNDLSL